MKRAAKALLAAALTAGLMAFPDVPASADPPPWAPAWGYRGKAKGKGKQRTVAAVPFGIDTGRCNRETLGAVLGGAAGAAAGSQIGSGSGKTAAVIGGTIIGVLIGGSIGRAMDQVDQNCVGQILEHAHGGQAVAWQNPDKTAQYQVTPVRTFERAPGAYCREYQATATVGGQVQRTYGTACRQPDGVWKIMN